MKAFLKFILQLFLILIITALLLDVLYTTIYHQSKGRNKIDYLYNSKAKTFDVVFLGSSRVNNHFVPAVFNDRGYSTFNFGLTRSRLEESALMLKLMIERKYKINQLILQVDLNINSNDHSEAIRSLFMPYLHTSKTIRDHYKTIDEYPKLLYIPFYRYMHYDARIGFREMYQSALQKRTNQLDNEGFYPLKTDQRPLVPADLSAYSPKRNQGYEEIKALCKANNIRLIAMATPICKNTINRAYFKQLKSIYPEIYNLEDTITEDAYFSSCGHMNEKGALLFTEIVFETFFRAK
jgi:hypothetical protein